MILAAVTIFWLWLAWTIYKFFAYRARSVAGKTVLITGGGSGIGRLMALDFAKRGAHVVLWDINLGNLDGVRDEITSAGGTVKSIAAVDVSNREAVYAAARELNNRVDVLINNAGIVTGKRFLDCPDELMVKTMHVNTIAHFWTLKAFLPKMIERNDGHVVTVASAAGLFGTAGLVDYCASKFGAVGIAESLHMELRRLKKTGVRTTLVCPFYINTGMFTGVKTRFPLLLPILTDRYAAGRIVRAVVYGEERVFMPRFLLLGLLMKVLPVPWSSAMAEFLGVSKSMDEFKGRE